jgi:transcriptional regulator with XRE-family HTH domain
MSPEEDFLLLKILFTPVILVQSGVPRTIGAIEQGRRWARLTTLHKLAKGLGVSTDELFQGSINNQAGKVLLTTSLGMRRWALWLIWHGKNVCSCFLGRIQNSLTLYGLI